MQNAQFLVNFMGDDEELSENKSPKIKSTYKPENERIPNKKKKKKKEEDIKQQNKNTISENTSNLINLQDSNTPVHKQINSIESKSDSRKSLDYKLESLEVLPMKEWAEECYYGKIEYKLKLINKSKERIQGLITQMKFRLREGNGTCFYEIGLEDSGNPLGLNEEELKQSLDTVHYMTEQIGAEMTILNYHQGKQGLIAELMINLPKGSEKQMVVQPEVRIGLIGEEGSGKSTLIGCLITNKNDNGKGLTRINVFRHKHEILCGKTSSISHQIVGLDEKGKVTNSNEFGGINDWAQIVEKSVKIINFFDMGGSEKSLKTTVKALSKNYLDYIFLLIAADKGITNTTSDFLKIALTLGLPVVTIITKIDNINEDDLGCLLNNFKYILKSEKKGKNPLVVQNKDDIVTFSRNINEGILPVFLISNKKGSGLNLFINFLNLLPTDANEDPLNLENSLNNLSLNTNISNLQSCSSTLNLKRTKSQKNETIFEILEILNVENKFILIGIVTKGLLLRGSQYKLGPNPLGNFILVNLISIHCKKVEVKSASQGQFCSIQIDDVLFNKECFHSGMVLLNAQSNPEATRIFECEVWSIDGKERKIKFSMQPMIHISAIRQSIKIFNTLNKEGDDVKLSCSEEEFLISPNLITKLYFEFMYVPEYIREGSHLIIYENNFKIFGYVTKIIK